MGLGEEPSARVKTNTFQTYALAMDQCRGVCGQSFADNKPQDWLHYSKFDGLTCLNETPLKSALNFHVPPQREFIAPSYGDGTCRKNRYGPKVQRMKC